MRPTSWCLGTLLLLSGCADATGLPNLVLGPGLSEVYASPWSGLRSPLLEAVSDEAKWTTLWDSIQSLRQPPPPRPPIDFTTQLLLVAALGERPTTGYSIHVDSLVSVGGTSTVFVTTYHARGSCATSPAFTQPVHVVAAPFTTNEITVAF